jgi:hypothetical protein
MVSNIILLKYAERFPERHHPGPRQLLILYSGQIDRTGLKILENNKNIQSIISVDTNIVLRRFRLKFLRIMYSISCSRWIEHQWCKSHTFGINFHMNCHSIVLVTS